MSAPNRATLWGRVLTTELARGGVSAVCLAPGSRSTPLAVAVAENEDIEVYSHLDERSAAFFALGRAKRTGEPTPVVCTSGTAAANLHPAVIEADRARVPLVVLTADRPPELADSGANQTIDQEKLYGSATRWYRDLPSPTTDPRALRFLRTTAARAITASEGTPPGPVHLNCRFRKPLEPSERDPGSPAGVPDDLGAQNPQATSGREGPFVRTHAGTTNANEATLAGIAAALDTERGLLVAGPATSSRVGGSVAAAPGGDYARELLELAEAIGVPVLADPLSGLRFGEHVEEITDGDESPGNGALVCGAYDAYLDALPDPEVVLRVGASPTSKALRDYLADANARQFVVDPAGGWREAEFTASDLVLAEPAGLASDLVDRLETGSRGNDTVDGEASRRWRERFLAAEAVARSGFERAHGGFFEGTIAADVAELAPDPTTIYVSNSMAVRDFDRFARPRSAALTVLGNRGASGIDGVVSSALGAGSSADDPLVLLIGDLAFYHDMNGLLALSRCGVDATIVLVNNDGGGIFEMLPIADFDPPFTEGFKTPHGLDFAPSADLYGFEFRRADSRESFRDAYRASVESDGTQVIEVAFDSAASHRVRERVGEAVRGAVGE